MKRIATVSSLSLLILCLAYSMGAAQDGVFSDAKTLEEGDFSLGIQPAIYTQNNEFMLLARGAYGIQQGLTLHGKAGFFREERIYVGTHMEYQLAGEPADPVSFSLLGGIYAFEDIGLKLGGVLSKQFSSFSLYTGMTFEPLFQGSEALTPLLLPIGVDIPIGSNGERTATFTFEADLGLNEDAGAYEAIHFGLKFYL